MPTEERLSRPLTDRQREVLELIRRRVLETQLPPTVREIGEHFDIRSTNGVRAILAALEKKGYLKRSPKLSRGLSVLPDALSAGAGETRSDRPAANIPASDLQFGQDFLEIPVLGRVAAGSPILAVQNLEGTVVVHRDFLAKQRDVFALKVIGDSMKDAGILDGDLVFARQQATARSGEIVVAMVGEDATVKTFIPEGRRVRLQPANESYSPIYVDSTSPDLRIVGRVIGVLRKYAF